jgi:polar amino acid transport system substrate-binding protein
MPGLTRTVLLAFAALLLAPPALQARTLDEILRSQKLIVGVNPSVPPTALFNEKNELDGFDVQFSRKIAALLGVAVEFVQVSANDRVPFVASGKVDYVMGAMTRTSARAKVIDFTVPVTTEANAVLTTQAKPFERWQDLNDPKVTVAEVRGTTSADFAKANLPRAKLLLLDDHPSLVTALAQGRADASINVVELEVKYMALHPDVKWKTLTTPVKLYYNGLGVAKGNDTLRNWLNVAIFELQSDGTVDALWKEWFKTDNIFAVKPNPYF